MEVEVIQKKNEKIVSHLFGGNERFRIEIIPPKKEQDAKLVRISRGYGNQSEVVAEFKYSVNKNRVVFTHGDVCSEFKSRGLSWWACRYVWEVEKPRQVILSQVRNPFLLRGLEVKGDKLTKQDYIVRKEELKKAREIRTIGEQISYMSNKIRNKKAKDFIKKVKNDPASAIKKLEGRIDYIRKKIKKGEGEEEIVLPTINDLLDLLRRLEKEKRCSSALKSF